MVTFQIFLVEVSAGWVSSERREEVRSQSEWPIYPLFKCFTFRDKIQRNIYLRVLYFETVLKGYYVFNDLGGVSV